MRLYETIFPSVTYLKAFDLLGAIDRACGGFGARLVRWSERRFFGGWDDMHRMSFTAPEEDECYFVYTMVAESVLLLFPYPRDLWIATRADQLPGEEGGGSEGAQIAHTASAPQAAGEDNRDTGDPGDHQSRSGQFAQT